MRILAMGAVALATLGFFAFLIFKVTAPDYTILFGDLEPAAAGQIVDRLEGMSVAHKLSDDGRTILVPESMVAKLRMDLAQNGLPAAGPAGYELLDSSNAFTSTDLLTNLNLRRALEGELARTITALNGVASARVHLVQPKRELFERDQQHSSASVFVKLKGSAGLEPRQVQGIRQLVASAVPGLTPERITIVDDQGNLLARAREDGNDEVDQDELESQRIGYEGRLRQKVLNLLEPSIGMNRVEVEIHADMDFDNETTTSESFDPDRAVPRSTQTTEDKSERTESQPDSPTTVSNNLPTAQAATPAPGPGSSEKTARTEETTNYEISKTVTNHVRRGAQIKRLTIAVQVAEAQVQAADGQIISQPRDASELAQLAALVKTATGFDEQRGDVVEIVSRKFSPVPSLADEAAPTLLSRIDFGKIANYGMLGGLALLLIFFGLRPLTRELARAAGRTEVLPTPIEAQAALVTGDDVPLLTSTATREFTPIELTEIADGMNTGAGHAAAGEEMVQLPQVTGAIRGELVRNANGLIKERPEETLRVLRGWLGGGQ